MLDVVEDYYQQVFLDLDLMSQELIQMKIALEYHEKIYVKSFNFSLNRA